MLRKGYGSPLRRRGVWGRFRWNPRGMKGGRAAYARPRRGGRRGRLSGGLRQRRDPVEAEAACVFRAGIRPAEARTLAEPTGRRAEAKAPSRGRQPQGRLGVAPPRRARLGRSRDAGGRARKVAQALRPVHQESKTQARRPMPRWAPAFPHPRTSVAGCESGAAHIPCSGAMRRVAGGVATPDGDTLQWLWHTHGHYAKSIILCWELFNREFQHLVTNVKFHLFRPQILN